MNTSLTPPPAFEQLLGDTTTAFSYKDNHTLRHTYLMYRLINHPSLVKVLGRVGVWAIRHGLPLDPAVKRTIFRTFCGGSSAEEALQVSRLLLNYHVETVLDYAAEGNASEAGYRSVREQLLQNVKLRATHPEVRHISLKMTGLVGAGILAKAAKGEALTKEEQWAMDQAAETLDQVCREAARQEVTVYIDAEETWLQEPMDKLALEMMRRYNRGKVIVYNTFQMYRKDALRLILKFLQSAREGGFMAGIKIVRGAYLEKEQQRAKQLGEECPVFSQKTDTDASFDQAIEVVMKNLEVAALCIASHNLPSTCQALQLLEEEPFKPYKDRVSFSQLYGMSDHLTFNLARLGYKTTKYLPYGSVRETVPYLLRRAEENSAISGQMSRELELLRQEMARRGLM